MLAWFVRWLGFRAVRRSITNGRGRPLLDIGLGFALLRDRRVPIIRKLAAMGLGGMAMAALVMLELPVEGLIAALPNLPGIGLDFLIDGLEILAGPLIIGSLFLIRLAPPAIAELLRQERGTGAAPSALLRKTV